MKKVEERTKAIKQKMAEQEEKERQARERFEKLKAKEPPKRKEMV